MTGKRIDHVPYDWRSDADAFDCVERAGIAPDWQCEWGGCIQMRRTERWCWRHAERREAMFAEPKERTS